MKDYSKLSKKERKAVLSSVANEIQKICEFGEDPKDLDGSEEKLIEWIKEAHPELKGEELSGLSEEAGSVFVALKLAKGEKAKKKSAAVAPAKDEDDLGELRKEVDACKKMKELKHLVNTYDSFEGLRDGISSYTSVVALKKYMFSILDGDLQVNKAKAKVTGKDSKKGSAKKDKEPKKPGVIATIQASIEKSGKKGISKEEILAKLEKAFPDRDSDSMKKTITAQVPNRMSKEKGIKIEMTKKGNNYFVA